MKIEKLSLEDIPFLISIRNECKHLLHNDTEFTVDQGIRWFEDNNPEYYLLKNDDTKIGYFRTSNLDLDKSTIYIGADIHQDFRGKGLAYKGYQLFMPFIVQKYQLKIIYLEVLSINYVAISLYNKLGFTIDYIEKNKICRDGLFIDNIKMSYIPNYAKISIHN